MIQANELMLGNFVDTPDGTVKITAISYEKVDVIRKTEKGNFAVYSESLDDIQPIPLTEEILLKCGFRKVDKSMLFLPAPNLSMEIHAVYFHGQYVIELQNHVRPIVTEAQHLHQLQNLYFALCGEELEVKL